MRARLPTLVRMYTGDHINYARLQDSHRVPRVPERPPVALPDVGGGGGRAVAATPDGAVPARRHRGRPRGPGARRRAHGARVCLMDSITRLSLNQITTERASLEATVEACARHGVPYVAVWRHKLVETGVERAVRLIRDAGIR